jgi:Lrp/AsnC family transcriptional regulator
MKFQEIDKERNSIPMTLDKFDRRILVLLQQDAAIPVAELAEKVGLSASPCWRRVQKLEAEGYIRGRVALLDAHKMNLGVTVFAPSAPISTA